jgi:DNA-binding IclR family transcriptional regulator
VPGRLDLVGQGRPVCEELAQQFGETVNLAVLRSHHAVNLDQSRGPAAVAAHNWVGQLTPLHATSSGKVLLAHQPADARKRLLDAAGLKRYTSRTVTSRRALAAELTAALDAGFATTVEEYEDGLNAIAAPVRDHTGSVVAAVSVSGPAYRLDEVQLNKIAGDVITGADQISRRLGFFAAS